MGRSAEYNSLRDELLQLSGRQVSLVTFALTVTVVLLGYGISNSNGLIPLVPLLMLAFAAIQLVRIRFGMIRISSYIAVFIESLTDDMGWETRAFYLRNTTTSEGPLKRSDVTVLSFGLLPLIVGFVCIAISFAYVDRQLRAVPVVVALIWLIFSNLIRIELNYAVSDELWKKYEGFWKKVDSDIDLLIDEES